MFRENRGVFYLLERFDGLRGEIAEKTAGTQMAIKTAFTTQFNPDTLIGAPPSPTKTRLRRSWRETIDQQQRFKSRLSSDCPLRMMMTEGLHARCRSILGLKLNACSIHPVPQRTRLAAGLAKLPSARRAGSGATCSWESDVQWRSQTWLGVTTSVRYHTQNPVFQ